MTNAPGSRTQNDTGSVCCLCTLLGLLTVPLLYVLRDSVVEGLRPLRHWQVWVLIGLYFLLFDMLTVLLNRRLVFVRPLSVEKTSCRYSLLRFIVVGLGVVLVAAILSPIVLADQDQIASWAFLQEHALAILLCGALGILPVTALLFLPSVAERAVFLSSLYMFFVGAIVITVCAYLETRDSRGHEVARSLVYSALPAALGYSAVAFASMFLILGLTHLITMPLGNSASRWIWYNAAPHLVAFAAYLTIFMYAAYIRLALCEQLAKT